MALIQVDVGASANSGTGDSLRGSFISVNSNSVDIDLAGPVGSNIRITGNTIISTDIDGDIVLTPDGTGDVSLTSHKIVNLTDPALAQDAATKNYVDTRTTFNGVSLSTGTGSPEGVVTASAGSMYTNTSGGAGTTLYVKESGAGNTGWAAK